jgi:AcrR family transcriptional regulator
MAVTTRERIVDRAVELFNERGTEAVGMRELARELGLSPGNLTYHFPRKEDLLIAIAARLSAANSADLGDPDEVASLGELFARYRRTFHNHVRYRCLILAGVRHFERYPELASRYAPNSQRRREGIERTLVRLRDLGHFRPTTSDREIGRLTATFTLTGRFWLAETWLDDRARQPEAAMDRYLDLLAGACLPYVTDEGRGELESFLLE